jgi:hypothetical protein
MAMTTSHLRSSLVENLKKVNFTYTVIRFVSRSAKFGICIAVGLTKEVLRREIQGLKMYPAYR